MILGQFIAQEQLTDSGVSLALVHGLTPETVHMCFSLPGATSRGWLPIVQHRGNPPCRGNLSLCEQNAKVVPR